MADQKFPGPYRNSVPQDLDNVDKMIVRVPASHTGIGARKSVLRGIKPDAGSIEHVGNMNGRG
jgi:hypothetical protein